MKYFLLLVRSVVPSAPAQLEMLFGVLCLFIAPNLRWAPWGFHTSPSLDLRVFVALGLCAIYFSGCVGYLVCFRPGIRAVRRLLWWVCLPATLGLILICGFYAATASSVALQDGNVWLQRLNSTFLVLLKLGPGFHYALLGLILVAGFTVRVALGSASLPLALPGSSLSASDESPSWRRVEIFLWVLLALLPAISWLFPFTNFIYYLVQAHIPVFKDVGVIFAQFLVQDSVIVLVAIWVIGKETWDDLRRSLRWPPVGSFALSIAFPVGIAMFISAGQFLLGLFRWIAYRSAELPLPRIGGYFTVPSAGLLWWVPVALYEEIIFRGILQPRFIRRYGALRGIFLVGIAFTAAHLSEDFSVAFTDGLVILRLGTRLSMSLALSFVTGWLTLRTGSVLPAAVAHGLSNVSASSPLGSAFFGIGPLTELLWTVLAYVLFRHWPVEKGGCSTVGAEGSQVPRSFRA